MNENNARIMMALSSNQIDLLSENENTRSNQIVAYHLDWNMHQGKLEQRMTTCAVTDLPIDKY